MNARTGRELWSFRPGAIESSPLIVDGVIYFGSWDHYVYAIDARTKRVEWRFRTDDQVVAGPAYSRGTIYIAVEQRPSLRDQRADGSGALARFVVLALRAARVLLRNAHRRLRPRLHRQRRRLRLLVRSEERQADLGSARRHVRLHGRGGVAEDGVRRDVGRLGRRVRRSNRQDALAPRLTRRCVRARRR